MQDNNEDYKLYKAMESNVRLPVKYAGRYDIFEGRLSAKTVTEEEEKKTDSGARKHSS